MSEPVTLTMSKNQPSLMVWDGRDYEVLDDPTLLDMEHEIMTHPLPSTTWRFIARADNGDTRVFDVRYDVSAQQWCLVRSYV